MKYTGMPWGAWTLLALLRKCGEAGLGTGAHLPRLEPGI